MRVVVRQGFYCSIKIAKLIVSTFRMKIDHDNSVTSIKQVKRHTLVTCLYSELGGVVDHVIWQRILLLSVDTSYGQSIEVTFDVEL